MGLLTTIGAALAAAFLAAAPTDAPRAYPTADPQALLAGFNQAWEVDDYEKVVDYGQRLIAHPVFAAQPDTFRYSIHLRHGHGLHRLERWDEALEHYDIAEPLVSDPALVHYWRFFTQLGREDWRRAHADAAALQDSGSDLFVAIRLRALTRTARELDRAGEADAHRDLIARILAGREPDTPFTTFDYLRLSRIRHLLEDGDQDAAAAMAAQITLPQALQEVSTLRVFEPVRRHAPFHGRATVEASLASLDARIAEHPEYLVGRHQRISDLLALGRFAEAEAEGRAVSDALAAGDTFEDLDEYVTWVLNEWAYALYALGRTEEGNAVMSRAAGLAELGSPNVSQTINLAAMLVYQDRPREALDTLSLLEDRSASNYGDMWVWSVAACAHEQLGDAASRDAELARLEAGWADNPSAYQRALICAGRTEDSAALMVRRLEDPAHQEGALAALHVMQPLFADIENAVRWHEALDALAEREDVRAAIDAIGRVEHYDLVDAYWGNF